MASIKDYLSQILKARYGKDVRQSIHDAIHQCYEDGKAGATDLEARELIDYKVGYPDYENANIIINRDDVHYTIEGDGYVFIKVRGQGSPSWPLVRLTINNTEVVAETVRWNSQTADELDELKYTSSLFPVKAGDIVSTVDCGPYDYIECFFVPYR